MFKTLSFFKKKIKIDFTTPQLNISVNPNKVLLSKEIGKNIIYVLNEGSVKNYFPSKDKIFPGLLMNYKGYFGYESFLEKSDFFPIFVTETKCIISTFPVTNLLSLLFKNSKTYIAYITQLIKNVERLSDYINQVIKFTNKLRVFNVQIANLIHFSGLKSSLTEYDDYLKDEYFNESEVLSLSLLKNNLNSNYKYDLINIKYNNLSIELFNNPIINELIPILKKNLKVINLINQTLFDDLEWMISELNLKLKLMDDELNNLFNLDNSFLKEINNQKENSIEDKWQKSYKEFFQILYNNIKKNKFINYFYDLNQMNDFLKMKINEVVSTKKIEEKIDDANEKLIDDSNLQLSSKEITLIKKIQYEKNLTSEQIKILAEVNQKFIKSFCNGFIKHTLTKEKLTESEKLLIISGVLDKKLITKEQFSFVKKRIINYKSTKNVFFLPKWLEKIADGTNEPSNDELSKTYRNYLLEQKRNIKKVIAIILKQKKNF